MMISKMCLITLTVVLVLNNQLTVKKIECVLADTTKNTQIRSLAVGC